MPPWTLADHLLANVSDHLAIANWQRSGGKSPPPEPVRRPGAVMAERDELTRDQAARLLALRNQREED